MLVRHTHITCHITTKLPLQHFRCCAAASAAACLLLIRSRTRWRKSLRQSLVHLLALQTYCQCLCCCCYCYGCRYYCSRSCSCSFTCYLFLFLFLFVCLCLCLFMLCLILFLILRLHFSCSGSRRGHSRCCPGNRAYHSHQLIINSLAAGTAAD